MIILMWRLKTMAKPRKQTYTMEMYLNKIKDSDIRSDQDVQRLSGQWDKSTVNELIVTVLTDNYIPPIILGEENDSQLWIIDGLQRSSSLMLFRHGNYRITSSVEEPVISYKAKVRDEKGNVKIDGNGDIVWEDAEFDIKNKTYEKLPEELKKRFNEYQIETVIHEGYGMKQISKLVRLYNNQKAMNTAQKTFTYVDNFAREIRNILCNQFFIDCTSYTANAKKNGTMERIIMETVMCMFHFDDWKKQSKQMGAYLNENATIEEFKAFNKDLCRLQSIITENLYDIFTVKDSFIWFTLFHKFTYSGLEDCKFAEFLTEFKENLSSKEVNGTTFELVDKDRSTKDRTVIAEKMEILETLLCDYLHIDRKNITEVNILEFVRDNVNVDITREDIELYKDMLSDFANKADGNIALSDIQNKPSLIAVIAYACMNDIQMDKWIVNYFNRNDTYISEQLENYHYMKCDIDDFVKLSDVA